MKITVRHLRSFLFMESYLQVLTKNASLADYEDS